jgi:glucose/arabinose dehydrogenase
MMLSSRCRHRLSGLGALALGATLLAGSVATSATASSVQVAQAGARRWAPSAPSGGGTGGGARDPMRFVSVALGLASGTGASPFDVPRRLEVPAGWRVEVWARVGGARFEALTPQGDLLVTVPSTGDVVELSPGHDPGAAPSRQVVLSGLLQPQGLAFDHVGGREVLYVGEADEIDRYDWGAGGPSGRRVLIGHLPWRAPKGHDDHPLKSLAVAPDHSVYFDIGSSDNVDTADLATYPPRASVLAVRPDGSGLRVLAIGVRNAEGLAVAPDGDLWAAVNERDNVPYPFHRSFGGQADAFGKVIRSYVNDNPVDELARVGKLRNLGWPFCNPTAEVRPGVPGSALRFSDDAFVPDAVFDPVGALLDCAKLKPIERGLPAHSAPLGLSFLESTDVPAPWRDGALLAVHGSWDRQPPQPPALLWMSWDARSHLLGTPVAVLSGFQASNGSRWGRPVDAVAGPGGVLYVSDNQAGAVYRVTP